MGYLDFINKDILSANVGSSDADINQLEMDLGFKIPLAPREYLGIMGDKTILYEYWDEHGTKDMVKLKKWIEEWIEKYRSEGILLDGITNVLPFFNFQDTFFYVPIEDGNDNPAVYAFDINDTPTIRKLSDNFVDFIKWKCDQLLKK